MIERPWVRAAFNMDHGRRTPFLADCTYGVVNFMERDRTSLNHLVKAGSDLTFYVQSGSLVVSCRQNTRLVEKEPEIVDS